MSWWSSFTSTFGAPLKTITGGGKFLNDEEKQKQEQFNATLKSAISNIDKEIESTSIGKIAKIATKSTADFLLKGAVKLNNNIISPYITRPASTLALVTDEESPLYKKGQYEEGFQFSDIKAAYNRSAKVSVFQALTKSELTPISSIASLVLPSGGIDMNKVDLWNDESIKENFNDNAVGRWFTGIGDFVVGNALLLGAGKAVSLGAKATILKPMGLYTKEKTIKNLAADMEQGISYAKSNGTIGAQTVSGSHMLALAESKDWGLITDLVSKYSTNERLIPLIHNTSDANVVKDLILADSLDIAALERLVAKDSSLLFDIADVKGQLRKKYIQTGKVYLPEGAAVPRIQKVLDDAINLNPQFMKIKNAFFDDNYSFLGRGKDYMPIEPKFGASALIKGQETLRSAKSAMRNREYKKFSGFAEALLGETIGGLAIRGVRFVGRGTESMPTGFVSFSGLRPLQARTELNGFLDNIKMFRDGTSKIETSPGVFEKVLDVRRKIEDQYMVTLGAGSVDQLTALKNIDTQVGAMLSYRYGLYDQEVILQYVKEFQNNTTKGIQSIKNNGFGFDLSGDIIKTDAQTIRQLAESYRFTPWDDIETQMQINYAKSRGGRTRTSASRAANEIFAQLNRVWTFDVLARPSYAFKQSLFEPIISAGVSQGIGFVLNNIIKDQGTFFLTNFGNITLGKLATITNRAQYKAVNNAVKVKSESLQRAIGIKETAQANVESLLKEASPATKKQNLPTAQKELKAASALLDEIELDLREAINPFGKVETIPSIATLERRVAYLESKPGITTKTAEIAEARAAITNSRNVISKLATNKKVIIDADNLVAAAYAKIDNALKELGEARVTQADTFGKSAEFKKRYYSKEVSYRMIGDDYVGLNSLIQESTTGGGNPFTAAYRQETKNAGTTQLTFLNELAVGQTNSLIKNKRPQSVIKVADETYFEELAHIANRQYRGDPLMDLIFSETSIDDIQRWAATDTGASYLRNFGVYNVKEVPSYIADKVALVQRMFPSYEARAAIVKGEVTSQQLGKSLAPYTDELYDITPSNHNYAGSNFGMGVTARFSNNLNQFAARQFTRLASVENPIRAAIFDKVALDRIASKATRLKAQGVDMTTGRLNALVQAAGREALQEMEKTLYTINNPNRLLSSLRLISAFPAANVNAIMRYGRMAARNPVRATGFMFNYGRAFQSFGVDENGNPTDDIDEITHLIVPGSKEFGSGPSGGGVKLSAQSLGFLLNRPSPSFVASLSLGTIMTQNEDFEKTIQDALTIGGTDYYKIIFPYGPATAVREVYTPPWSKGLVNSIVGPNAPAWQTNLVDLIMGPKARKDLLGSYRSIYNHHAMLVEMGIEEDMPSDKEIEKEVKALQFTKFHSSFSSPFAGIPFKVETSPMALTNNLYYKLQEKYVNQGLPNQAARDAAGEEMLSLLGPKFMLDRVTFTGSSKNVNMPATIDAYKRVFRDNDDLVGRLAQIEPGEIGLVGLLTADLSYDPKQQSANILNILSNPDTVLPGTSSKLNELKMTPQEIEVQRLKQRTWSQYTAIKEALTAKITDGRSFRAHPELKNVLETISKTLLKEQSQAWFDEYSQSFGGDASYKYARALTEITTDKKWMATSGQSTFYQDAKSFLESRSMFANFYQALPDYDPRKAKLVKMYNSWVEQNVGQWDANLSVYITRYFDNDTLKVVN